MIDTITDTATLTKLIVNPGHPRARHDLRDVHLMHQTMTKLACPPDFGPSSRSAAGLLYRIEHTSAGVVVLAQSRTAIDPTQLPAGFAHGGSRDLGPLLSHLTTGIQVRYRIVANPTKRSPVHESAKRGELRPLVGEEALTWWQRKADEAGLELTAAEIIDTNKLTGTRSKNRQQIVITATTIEGVATVNTPHLVRGSILSGIGRGRAYGCGLLSVAALS